jgi:hypothetical protein
MNKTLVAALSGVAFGSILGGIAASYCGQASSHQFQVTVADCPVVTAPACPAVLPPAPPLPARCSHEAASPEPYAMTVDAQLSRAQTEYVNGNYQRAIEITLPLTSQSPERAFRILGAAACNTHDGALADRAFNNLQTASRQYLIYACQRQQMVRAGSHFKHIN